VVTGTLVDIAERAAGVAPPATIVIGEVAGLSDKLAWFEPGGEWAQPSGALAARPRLEAFLPGGERQPAAVEVP
jgi:hypothetical protein